MPIIVPYPIAGQEPWTTLPHPPHPCPSLCPHVILDPPLYSDRFTCRSCCIHNEWWTTYRSTAKGSNVRCANRGSGCQWTTTGHTWQNHTPSDAQLQDVGTGILYNKEPPCWLSAWNGLPYATWCNSQLQADDSLFWWPKRHLGHYSMFRKSSRHSCNITRICWHPQLMCDACHGCNEIPRPWFGRNHGTR